MVNEEFNLFARRYIELHLHVLDQRAEINALASALSSIPQLKQLFASQLETERLTVSPLKAELQAKLKILNLSQSESNLPN